MAALAEKYGLPLQTGNAGTMFGFYFLKEADAVINDYSSAKQYAHTDRYAEFFHAMLANGVYFAPSQFEAGFVSAMHDEAVINETLNRADDAMSTLS